MGGTLQRLPCTFKEEALVEKDSAEQRTSSSLATMRMPYWHYRLHGWTRHWQCRSSRSVDFGELKVGEGKGPDVIFEIKV